MFTKVFLHEYIEDNNRIEQTPFYLCLKGREVLLINYPHGNCICHIFRLSIYCRVGVYQWRKVKCVYVENTPQREVFLMFPFKPQYCESFM